MARTSTAGIQPSEVQNSVHTYAEDAEASDAYAITLTPAVSAYTAGQMFLFKANTANTGAASLNVNGLGAKTIKKHKGEDLADNDIKADSVVSVVYDGTNFQMISMLSNAPAGSGDMTKAVYDTNDDGKVNEASAVEGTGVKSTGEAGGTKFLREDGDGTCSWQEATATIADDSITYAKIQNVVADNVILGNNAGAGGIVDELTATEVRTILNVADGANNYVHPNHIGDVTSTGDGATVITNSAVTLAKQANVDTSTVFYRKTAGAGAPEVQTLATLKTDLGLTGTNSGDQTLPTRDSLGLDTDDSPRFAGINLGHASDTTLSRVSAGVVAIEGVTVPTISSTNTLTNKTIGGATPLDENASLDLDGSLSADGKYTGIAIDGTAGAALAFGDVVYLAAADSRWELCDASAVGTAGTVLIGICVLAAAGDASATKVLLHGTIRADTAFPAFTISAPVYISETAGDATQTAPTTADAVVRVLGYAITADSMYFNPSPDHITHTG